MTENAYVHNGGCYAAKDIFWPLDLYLGKKRNAYFLINFNF